MISAQDFLRNQSVSQGAHSAQAEKQVSVDELQDMAYHSQIQGVFQRSEQENKCQEAALRLLDAAQRPTSALKQRLLQKEFSEDIIDTVVDRLISLGLIDDEAYARSAVRYCVSRHMGQAGTLMELKRKGVDATLASQAVQEAAHEGVFVESAYALVERVARRTQGLDQQVRLRRLWSAAGRKGHSPDLIRRAQYEIFDADDESDA
ncbi:regulatory protein RecX [Alloscardovia omnicolens]|uniref:regulatory protein RecX n=1 Tax=Alloscardovia omnicolens TaxID=419015 RepID=UPI003A78759F